MLVLSHRGCWKTPAEKNAPTAFARSFQSGFGTETDLRDLAGRLVISHDPPIPNALPAETFFEIHRGIEANLPLALNIKADGLQSLVKDLLDRFQPADAFVFDMSVPDMRGYLNVGLPVFTRHSEVEQQPAFYNQATGVWLDGFDGEWWTADTIRRHLDAGKRVCVVSPDLHGRDPAVSWDRLADFRVEPRVLLCTDRPEEAAEVFRA